MPAFAALEITSKAAAAFFVLTGPIGAWASTSAVNYGKVFNVVVPAR